MPPPVIIIDTREPSPHPWTPWWPAGTLFESGTLETGDLAVKGFEDGAVVERKTPSDFLGCVGTERDRFEKELRRARNIGHFIVIVEGSLQRDCCAVCRCADLQSIADRLRRQRLHQPFTGGQQ